jgi:hypothetical protein
MVVVVAQHQAQLVTQEQQTLVAAVVLEQLTVAKAAQV